MIEIKVEFIPRWCTIGACFESIFKILDPHWDFVDILGLTAMSYRINVSRQIGISGPTSLDWISLIPDMANQLGYEAVMIHGIRNDRGFVHVRQEALEFIEAFLSEGKPVIAWDLWIPEFGIITGIDDKRKNLKVKTVISNPKKDFFPTKKLGNSIIPMLLVFSLEEPLADYDFQEALLWSFQAAWRHLEGLEKALPTYTLGLKAYDTWIKVLQNGEIRWDGHAYMLQYLHEVRSTIPPFLQRILKNSKSLKEDHLESIQNMKKLYEDVILPLLSQLSSKFPFTRPFQNITSENELESVTNSLEKIRLAEEKVSTLLKKFASW